MSEYILRTEDLVYSYSNRQARPSLDHININIRRGKRTVILGANGAGKSTLFYHFNGVFKPKEGRVFFDGEPLEYTDEHLSRLRDRVAVVVQNPDEQIFSATVEEDVAFGPMNMEMPREEVEKRITDSLLMVGMLDYRSRPTVQLSYGQRKRVAIAGALACKPEVLILDEPTAGLDPQMALEVLELVNQLCISGTTVIISTHDVDLAYAWAEEMFVLRNGELVFGGMPEMFFENREEVYLSGLTQPHTFSVNSIVERISGKECSPYPRTNSQLLAKKLPADAAKGRIWLFPVEKDPEDPLPDMRGRVGIYGFDTRRAFDRNGYVADYYYNAVECCMIEALGGNDASLYCDKKLADAIRRYISNLAVFGHEVEVIRWMTS